MEANWKPFEERLQPAQCAGFSVMGRLNGINLHEQGLSGRYLKLGDDDRVYRYLERGRFEEIPFEEALNWLAEPFTEKGETLETPYDDEEHKARRSAALRAAGWHELRVHIQPGEVAIH